VRVLVCVLLERVLRDRYYADQPIDGDERMAESMF